MKPILFNTEMVQAILDGKKTQTRRVAKDMRHPFFKVLCPPDENGIITVTEFDGGGNQICMTERQAKYKVGDILWVRETWCNISDWTCVDPSVGLPDGFIYKADWHARLEHPRWRPSIHMPKEVARIFLKVTSVRVERVQDTTEEDANAEGAIKCYEQIHPFDGPVVYVSEDEGGYYTLGFKSIWNSINSKRGCGWDVNPWVWVYEFERVDKPNESK